MTSRVRAEVGEALHEGSDPLGRCLPHPVDAARIVEPVAEGPVDVGERWLEVKGTVVEPTTLAGWGWCGRSWAEASLPAPAADQRSPTGSVLSGERPGAGGVGGRG